MSYNQQSESENQRTAGRQLSLQESDFLKERASLRAANKPYDAKTYSRSTKKESKPKGHEAFLKALETAGATICVEYVESIPSDPMTLTGVVKHSDAYTISIDVGGATAVVFKHAIRCFTSLTPRKEGE